MRRERWEYFPFSNDHKQFQTWEFKETLYCLAQMFYFLLNVSFENEFQKFQDYRFAEVFFKLRVALRVTQFLSRTGIVFL